MVHIYRLDFGLSFFSGRKKRNVSLYLHSSSAIFRSFPILWRIFIKTNTGKKDEYVHEIFKSFFLSNDGVQSLSERRSKMCTGVGVFFFFFFLSGPGQAQVGPRSSPAHKIPIETRHCRSIQTIRTSFTRPDVSTHVKLGSKRVKLVSLRPLMLYLLVSLLRGVSQSSVHLCSGQS